MTEGKIILVIPPAPYLISDKVFPPLGVLYVAALLEKNGVGVSILDLTGRKEWESFYVKTITAAAPRFIGLTATTPDFPVALRLLELARQTLPKAQVIIGGAHATIKPSDCLAFDKVVVGDGWSGILQVLKGGSGKLIEAPLTHNLDDMPFPARHLIDLKGYSFFLDGRKAAHIMSHLGCPFNCVFCSGRKHSFYNSVRFRSPENVISEMDFLNKEYGFGAFVFYDDEFNLSREVVNSLCKLLMKRDYIWRAPIRADMFDLELAVNMKMAGCREVSVGVESGSERVLKMCNKGTTPQINSAAREVCRKTGIRFKAFTVVGLPGATLKDEEETRLWLINNAPDDFDVAIHTPYPGTEVYDSPEKFGITYECDFSKEVISYKVAPGKYKSFARNEYLDFDELVKLRDSMDAQVRKILGLPAPGAFNTHGPVDHSKGAVSAPVAVNLKKSGRKSVES